MRIHIVGLTLLWAGCGGEPPSPPPAPQPQAPQQPAAAAEENAAPDTHTAALPTLATGSHSAFGLALPRGMMPMKSPAPGVYRFEGTHPVAAVQRFIEAQLAPPVDKRPTRMVRGVLFTGARLLRPPQGDDVRIDVKVYEGSLGAAVEVWRSRAEERRAGQNGGFRRQGATQPMLQSYEQLRSQVVGTEAPDPPRTPAERRAATLRVIEKMAQGRPLSPEDYQSPYFTER